jgi:hypothetical protein
MYRRFLILVNTPFVFFIMWLDYKMASPECKKWAKEEYGRNKKEWLQGLRGL